MKRILALVMALCMLLSMTTAFATGCAHDQQKVRATGTATHEIYCAGCGVTLETGISCEWDAQWTNGVKYCTAKANGCTNTKTCDHEYEAENNDTEHWKECKVCGVVTEKAEHTMKDLRGNGIMAVVGTAYNWECTNADCEYFVVCDHTAAPRVEISGDKCAVFCSKCNGIIQGWTAHKYDETLPTCVEQECAACGTKNNPSAHQYQGGVPGTYHDNGDNTHSQVCKACGDVKDQIDTHIASNAGANAKWEYTAEGHVSTCIYCGGKIVVEHDWKAGELVDGNVHTLTCQNAACTASNGGKAFTKTEAHKGGTLPTDCDDPQAVCSECGGLYGTVPAHTWEWKKADNNVHRKTCSKCGATAGDEPHVYTVVDGKRVCSICSGVNNSGSATCAPDKHQYKVYEPVYMTCKNGGVNGFSGGKCCTVCGAWEVEPTTEPWKHAFTVTGQTAGTCTAVATTTKTCSECGITVTETGDFGHVWSYGEITTPATCVNEGVQKVSCTLCPVSTTIVLPKIAHSYEFVQRYKGADDDHRDCTNGIEWNLVCTNVIDAKTGTKCNIAKNAWETIEGTAEKAHATVETSVKGTCLKTAYTLVTCGNEGCDYKKEIGGQVNSGATHPVDECVDVKVEATCFADGYDLAYCTKCETYTNNAGTVDYLSLEEGIKANKDPKLTHTNTEATKNTGDDDTKETPDTTTGWYYVEPTCQSKGYWESTCLHCEQNYRKIFNETEAGLPVPHKFDKDGKDNMGEVVLPADCENGKPGIAKSACIWCGIQNPDKEYVEIPAEHKWVVEGTPDVAPTCTTTGKGWMVCSACDAREYRVIPALETEHKWAKTVVPADCHSNAYEINVCVYCGAEDATTKVEKTGTKLDHVWGEPEEIKNCRWTYAYVQVCTLCGERSNLVGTGELPGIAHIPTIIEVEKGSCDERGKYYLGCKNCDQYLAWADETDEIQPGKHDLVNAPQYRYSDPSHTFGAAKTIVGTCVTKSAQVLTCEVCGFEKTISTGAIDATNHAEPYVVETIKAADCYNDGIVRYGCTACGEIDKTYSDVPAGHKFDDDKDGKNEVDEIVLAPTCGADGYGYALCSVCGIASQDVVLIEKTGKHTLTTKTEFEDCTKGGNVYEVCSVCGYEKKISEIPAKAHTMGNPIEVKEPDCVTDSGWYKKCSVCGYMDELTDNNDALGHLWNEEVVREANCYVEGLTVKTCVRCGEVEEITAPMTEHDMELDVELSEASTCHTKGYNVYVCSHDCGFQYKEVEDEYDEDNHVWVTAVEYVADDCSAERNGLETQVCKYGCDVTPKFTLVPYEHEYEITKVIVAPTCWIDGVAEATCKVCGDVAEVDKDDFDSLKKLEHKMVTKYVEADCVKVGGIYTMCELCEFTTEVNPTGDALGHIWNDGVYAEADCTEPARTVYTCARCGEEAVVESETIKALGHKYSTDSEDWTVVEPTCQDKGYTLKTCERCGEEVKTDFTPIKSDAHVWDIEKTYLEATCDTNGFAKGQCKLCKTKSEAIVLPKYEHKGFWSGIVVAEGGMAIYRYCTNCGEIDFLAVADNFTGFKGCTRFETYLGDNGNYEKVLVGAHTLVKEESTEADCVNPGVAGKVSCSVCGVVLSEKTVVEALGHKAELIPAVAPTCTEVGYTAGSKCSVCGEILVAPVEVPAAHDKVVTTPAKDAECDIPGTTEGAYCTKCDWKVEAEVIPALKHVEVEMPAVEATASSAGLTAGIKCDVCGKVLKAQEVIPAKGGSITRYPAVLREEASNSATRLKTVEEETSVEILSEMTDNGFYKVKVDGLTGYMYKSYITVG